MQMYKSNPEFIINYKLKLKKTLIRLYGTKIKIKNKGGKIRSKGHTH